MFGLRASEHRMLRLRDVKVGSDFIRYEENTSKTFHGGIKDLKKKARIVNHICHKDDNQDHERCLCKIYNKYFELVQHLKPEVREKAFYFQPFGEKMAFKNCVVGVHTLGSILPNLCQAIGTKRKTSHSLRVSCASKLFNNNVEEKLIRDRTGHVSNAHFQYEKSSYVQQERVSNILGPVQTRKVCQDKSETDVRGNVLEYNWLPNVSDDFDDSDLPSFDCGIINDMSFMPINVEQQAIEVSSYAAHGPVEPKKTNTFNIDGHCNVTINNYK
ncbi:MAG: hypothetical protein DSY43_06040 [Gammaproteobacteria bacterium]|nr:MAG: hypothetical protein DSY43_06040 [Gammaproteobacteria bacterium]